VTAGCLSCLRPVHGPERHHPRCARRLFGADAAPRLDLGSAEFQTVALATVGRSSLAGVQRKISVGIHAGRRTLRVELGGGGRFILKPQVPEFPALPENEHLTMELARGFGLAVPDRTLLELADGTLAYVVVRFDRPPEGGKRRQEDFCQLRLLPPASKYDGTAIDCANVIRRYSTEPGADLVRLFETFVFAYWVGNGDLHQKNLSLLADESGRHLLSPAYDHVCTALYPGLDSRLGLPLAPDESRADRAAWLRFARHCGIPERGARRILERPRGALRAAAATLDRSHLPAALQPRYLEILRARAAVLAD